MPGVGECGSNRLRRDGWSHNAGDSLAQRAQPSEVALAQTIANKVEAACRRIVFLDKRRLLMRDGGSFAEAG